MPKSKEGGRKVRLFKPGPRSKTWSAELYFPSGVKEEIQTNFADKHQASAHATGRWRVRARELGFVPPSKFAVVDIETKKTAQTVAMDTFRRKFELNREMGKIATRDESFLQRKLRAIVEVAKAVEGLTPEAQVWVFNTVSQAQETEVPGPAPRLSAVQE